LTKRGRAFKQRRMRSLFALVFVAACSGSAPEAPATPGVKKLGEPIAAGAATSLASVVATPDAFAGKSILTEGFVRQVCQRKGCWMEIAATNAPEAAGARVTFKDYGFFVPKTSAGSQARLEGVVEVRTIEKAHVAHYESEGAHVAAKQADGSARELTIVAKGVELAANSAPAN
jgi:hypothetical protein